MNKSIVAFVVSAAVTTVLGASTQALAATWYRTVEGSVCLPRPNKDTENSPYTNEGYRCAFPSDQVIGATAPGGNAGVTSIYADFVVGEVGATNLSISACGTSYNLNAGACGTPVNFPKMANGVYDQWLPLWTGTGSAWDYFFVDFSQTPGGWIGPRGIGVTGAQ
jgi:hypothetical protein